MCNYCSKTYTKNATKMQMHLDKCKEYSVISQQSPGPDGSSSASISVPSFSFLASASPGRQFLIDSMDQHSEAFADACLARAVYATSSPLTLMENIYWKRFLRALRPSYCPPNTDALSSHLLDHEYDRVQCQVNEAIAKADCVTILCSGWSNRNKTGNLIYMVATPVPLFYKFTQIQEQTNSRLSIADELKNIISDVGPQKVIAVITDDAPEMMAAWAEVEEAYPHISAFGCTASRVQQLFDEIIAQPSMKALCNTVEQVLSYLRERNIPVDSCRCSRQTTKRRSSSTSSGTTLPPSTSSEWTDVIDMFNSLLEAQNSLQEMSVSTPITDTLQDAAFWKGLCSSRNLLSLIGSYVDFLKREDCILSGVVDMFSQLRYHIEASLSGSVLHSTEQKAVLASIDRCQEFCIRPIHAAAYILDPKHVGQQTLSAEQINAAYYVISRLSQHLNLEEGKVLASFARFSAKEGLWKGAGIWSSFQHVSASTWWKGLCSSEPLSSVASAILQIPPTTGCCECLQSWFCSTKAHVSLSADRVQKLAAVQANLKHLVPSECEYSALEADEDRKVLFQSEIP